MESRNEGQLFQQVITEAWENANFKTELVANPVAAIEELTGVRINLPEGKTLIVRDQTDQSVIYINIPAKPNIDDLELNEEQLEVIAGGGIIFPIINLDFLNWVPGEDGGGHK
ncbi:TOMM propeptide domain-containing protein [Tenacibaculum sp. SZ-18]|uniref:NHLP leader peptide family RiPP precursor n=1 Tax=Tenacibaculum sp. SZ-18 TaxID=754423 RepID=UPI000C2D67CA|nr:NHLP leader peptide family RiPP precursor [Tenacibaculum sp. SZ-18]AUC16925.1 TOMM propeptide domain-containing protein [Tenacibaculum sp. SZ-18]